MPGEESIPSASERARDEAERAERLFHDSEVERKVERSDRLMLAQINMMALQVETAERTALALEALEVHARSNASCLALLEETMREMQPIPEPEPEHGE